LIKLIFLSGIYLISNGLLAETASSGNTKTIIKYKERTTVDLTGTTVEGKIRTPEVFYIFKRKRALNGKIFTAPSDFNHHDGVVDSIVGQKESERER